MTPKPSTPSINKWLSNADKWISILEKWEIEGNLIRQLYQLSATGRTSYTKVDSLPLELDCILENEIRPLKFLIFEFSNNLQSMELFPAQAKKRIAVLRIKLHRIGEKYDKIKHDLLVDILENYPISII